MTVNIPIDRNFLYIPNSMYVFYTTLLMLFGYNVMLLTLITQFITVSMFVCIKCCVTLALCV